MPRTKPQPTPFSRFRLDFTPLRQRRRQLDMTQRQLAAAIGVHVITIYRTEKNRSEPTLSQMLAIARSLGTPVHLLFTVTSLPDPDGRA